MVESNYKTLPDQQFRLFLIKQVNISNFVYNKKRSYAKHSMALF